MGASKIEWTRGNDGTSGKVWNPVTGCSHAGSPGCDHCYAKRMAYRLQGRYGYPRGWASGEPKGDPFKVTFHPDRLEEPLHWKKPSRIFVCSMGDLFHKSVKVDWIDSILEVMSACPQHTFMILTKRPENIETKFYSVTEENPCRELGGGDYLPNLYLGVSVEDQKTKPRIDILRGIPAFHRFISFEPLLEDIGEINFEGISWCIVGGETGPGARPLQPDWIRSIRDQCQASGTPFFFKSYGEWAAGHLLDGKEWREFPK